MCTCKRCFTKRTGLNVKDIIAKIEARKQQKTMTASGQAPDTDGNTATVAPAATGASATDASTATPTATDATTTDTSTATPTVTETAANEGDGNTDGNAKKDPDLTVVGIIRDVLPWILANDEFDEQQKKAARAMAVCKTEELGGFLQYCPNCDEFVSYQYCSCGNRNCPQCQYPLEKRWIELRKAEVIPGVQYYHNTCTIPHDLNDLYLANYKAFSSLLFRAASESVIQICADPKVLGAKPGIVTVYHSWTGMLLFHPHVHMVISGGGLDKDGNFVNLIDLRKKQKQLRLNAEQNNVSASTSTVETSVDGVDGDDVTTHKDVDAVADDAAQESAPTAETENTYDYFFNGNAQMAIFRGIFMASLRDMYMKKQLVIPKSMERLADPLEWAIFCHQLENKQWVGHINKTFGNGKGAFESIGHYVTRHPMSDKDLESYSGDMIMDEPFEEEFEGDCKAEESNGDAFDYLGRYAFCTAITNHRLQSYEDKTVSFWVRDNEHPGQRTLVSLNVYEFVRRLLMHVLPKGFTRIRFSGFLANCCKTKNLQSIFQQVTEHDFIPSPLKESHGLNLMQAIFPDGHYGECPVCGSALESVPFGLKNPWLARGVPVTDK